MRLRVPLMLLIAGLGSGTGLARAEGPKPAGSAAQPGGTAVAEAKRAAAALLNDGNARFKQKDYSAALSKYEAAYQTYPSAKILFNLAEALAELDRADEAATAYERFLKEAAVEPRSKMAKVVRKRLKALEPKLAYLSIESQTSGPSVTIDGLPTGTLPFPKVRVAPGPHAVNARLAGHEPYRVEVDAVAGQTTPVRIKMSKAIAPPESPIAKAPPSDLNLKPAPAASASEPPMAAVTSAGPPSASEPLTSKWWFWTAIGVAAAAAATVVIVALPKGSDFAPGGELGASGTSQWQRL